VQKLRALAVLCVLFYHFGLGFSRGYLGVDVFFVISGFVITRSILIKNEKLKVRTVFEFYTNRVLRLFPAFAAMFVFVFVVSFLVLSPNIGVQQQAIKSGVGSLFGVSNVLIPRITGGYFDTPSKLNPFLHTWSLSVENQFYFIFPVFIALIIFKYKTRVKKVFTELLLFSIFLSSVYLFVELEKYPLLSIIAPAYFSPLTRIWEFMLGLYIARALKSQIRTMSSIKNLTSGVFVIGILFLTNYDGLDSRSATFLVVILTSLIIVNTITKGNTFDSKWTSKLLDWIGDRSYSIYLYHWPIFVLLPVLFVGYFESLQIVAIAITLTLFLSELSFRYLEKEFQSRLRGNLLRIWKFTGLGFAALLIYAASITSLTQSGMNQSWALTNHEAIKRNCDLGLDVLPEKATSPCVWKSEVEKSKGKEIFIFGDSLAWSGADSVIDAGLELGYSVTLHTRNGCYARFGKVEDQSVCSSWSRSVFDEIVKSKPKLVMLYGNYREALPDETLDLLTRLKKIQQRTIIVLPPPDGDYYSEIRGLVNFGIPGNRTGSLPGEVYVPQEYLEGLFSVFQPHQYICKETRCPISEDGNEYYNYGNHLSNFGNSKLTAPLRDIFEEVGKSS
jgi:peptidoglycan/LPS O-acetylase OafA/YrhL